MPVLMSMWEDQQLGKGHTQRVAPAGCNELISTRMEKQKESSLCSLDGTPIVRLSVTPSPHQGLEDTVPFILRESVVFS